MAQWPVDVHYLVTMIFTLVNVKFKTQEAEDSKLQDLFMSDDELSEGSDPQCRQSMFHFGLSSLDCTNWTVEYYPYSYRTLLNTFHNSLKYNAVSCHCRYNKNNECPCAVLQLMQSLRKQQYGTIPLLHPFSFKQNNSERKKKDFHFPSLFQSSSQIKYEQNIFVSTP